MVKQEEKVLELLIYSKYYVIGECEVNKKREKIKYNFSKDQILAMPLFPWFLIFNVI